MRTEKSWLLATAVLALAAQQPEPWENPVRKRLREGKPVVGLTVTTPSPDVAALAANLGFDFIWIEMEHSAITLETARSMILATRGTGTVPFVRVPVNELWTAKRALDVGALGVIFPFTSTPELARQAVEACKYPPLGKRGFGPGLAGLRWPAPGGYPDFADRNAMVVVIIEQKEAVERIEEIAAVPGIDVLFVGTADLSFSLGLRGRQDHPQLREAVARVVAAAAKRKVPAGRPAGNAAQLREFADQGFLFLQAPSELSLMGTAARPLLEALGKTPATQGPRPLY
ncbi:MAG: aldolase/citrate lyase family protein [Bryobacterales bacterium]|nr:aldolase/citrate lyase family protein [Bryobacteraceae bacterium]MDW8129803.1 aldolase/citrate lyase family protein [Bryobacterales bacterium]